MAGVHASRGIAYQNAQAVLVALDVVSDPALVSLRIEGVDDIVDIEVHGPGGVTAAGYQVKTRGENRPWGKGAILRVLDRWVALGLDIPFEFVTDGPLGPSATALSDAISAAAEGDSGRLAAFLGRDVTDPELSLLARTRVRRDVTGDEAVLALAKRRVRSLLPGLRTESDLDAAATGAVNALLRELASRSGSDDEDVRVVTKDEIAEILGGVRDVPAADRWSTGVKDDYVAQAAGANPGLVDLEFLGDWSEESDRRLSVLELVSGSRVVLLAGRTGSGKSSAASLAVFEGARTGNPVVRVHAEAYVASRLNELVAEALSATTGRPLPASSGQQALWDTDLTLIVDGFSEVPAEMRDALGEQLRPLLASASGGRVVLAGRDVAVLARAVPPSVPRTMMTVASLGCEQKRALVRRLYPQLTEDDTSDAAEHVVNRLLRTAEAGLGDAAGNPMLFTMALSFAVEGTQFDSDAALYRATVTRMAERSGAVDVDLMSAALGIVFAELLDSGRRFVYPHEYRRLLRDAADRLRSEYFDVDEEGLADNVHRTGLLIPLGSEQVLVPVHDSFADFLAGMAHSRDLATLPDKFAQADERRLQFAADLGLPDLGVLTRVTRDLPFSVVRLADTDSRVLDGPEGVQEASALLTLLQPPREQRRLAAWSDSGYIVAALTNDEADAGWAEEPLPDVAPRIAFSPGVSPLRVAVSLWRVMLRAALRSPRELPLRRPQSIDEAVASLTRHLTERNVELADLVATALQPVAARRFWDLVGPTGVNAVVYREPGGFSEFLVRYESSQEIHIAASSEASGNIEQADLDAIASGTSSVEHLLSKTARADAAGLVKKTVESLTENAWLQ